MYYVVKSRLESYNPCHFEIFILYSDMNYFKVKWVLSIIWIKGIMAQRSFSCTQTIIGYIWHVYCDIQFPMLVIFKNVYRLPFPFYRVVISNLQNSALEWDTSYFVKYHLPSSYHNQTIIHYAMSFLLWTIHHFL